jgi:hypothetical protein
MVGVLRDEVNPVEQQSRRCRVEDDDPASAMSQIAKDCSMNPQAPREARLQDLLLTEHGSAAKETQVLIRLNAEGHDVDRGAAAAADEKRERDVGALVTPRMSREFEQSVAADDCIPSNRITATIMVEAQCYWWDSVTSGQRIKLALAQKRAKGVFGHKLVL